jgi:hypothetical protein
MYLQTAMGQCATTRSKFAAQLQQEMEKAAASRKRLIQDAAKSGERRPPATLAPPNTSRHNTPRREERRTGFSPEGDTFRSSNFRSRLLQHEDRLAMPPPAAPSLQAQPGRSGPPGERARQGRSHSSSRGGGRPRQAEASRARKNRRFVSEVQDLENQLRGFQATGISKGRLELSEADLDRAHQHLEDMLEAYDECLESVEDQGEVEIMELERDDLEEWATASLRRLRVDFRTCLPHQDIQPGLGARSNLQRVKLPVFTGRAEDWPEFRRLFQELTEGEGLRPAVLLAQLRDSLNCEQAKSLIVGKTVVDEAWNVLDRRYGDRELAVINTKYQLLHLDTTKGQPHEQVEALQQGVAKSISLLRSVKAEAEFLDNLALIAHLVAKLPQSWQERWHLDRTDPRFNKTNRRWAKSSSSGWIGRARQQILQDSPKCP